MCRRTIVSKILDQPLARTQPPWHNLDHSSGERTLVAANDAAAHLPAVILISSYLMASSHGDCRRGVMIAAPTRRYDYVTVPSEIYGDHLRPFGPKQTFDAARRMHSVAVG
jgi:hypothetical protein